LIKHSIEKMWFACILARFILSYIIFESVIDFSVRDVDKTAGTIGFGHPVVLRVLS